MKKKLFDRRGAGIELAILMMVVSFSMAILLTSVALLQSTKKVRAEKQLQQSIALEQLGQDFLSAVRNGDAENWTPTLNCEYTIEQIESGETGPQQELATVYRLLVSRTQDGKYLLKIEVEKADDESTGENPCVPENVVLKIVLTLDETNNTYKITEWTKNDRS